jgi:chemotaxis protein MotB
MRRRKKAHPPNHDRWLVSYADLITLLFAFFVVMFASTQTDKTRAKQISEAVQRALHEGSTPPKVSVILGGTVDDRGRGNDQMHGPGVAPKKDVATPATPHLPDLASALDLLRDKLHAEIEGGSVSIHSERRGVIIGLNSAVFFPPGDDTIEPGVYPTLAKVAAVLNQLPNALRLEGNTDALPISNARFRSNWELSAARSIAMLRVLHEEFEVASNRMAVVGYADTNSVESNDTEAGRTKNRRVDIVIVSDYGMRQEPGAIDEHR